jgi:DNA-binding LacI/PurR family transcriptional regulator
VAAAAGVSTATASLVLRGKAGPSGQTAADVLAAADRLGYRPDRTASLLARRRSSLVGVLFEVTNPFHAELVDELDRESADRGRDLVLSAVTSRRTERHAVETLIDFRCEGLVMLGPTAPASQLDVIGAAVPTVVLGRSGTPHVQGILASDAQGLADAVDHLVGLGHRRIAYIDGPRGSIATARRRGYRAAMTRAGLGDQLRVVPGGNTEVAGLSALAQALDSEPTAIVAFNDRCAIGVRDGLIRAGRAVPQAVSVVGYDDGPVARLATISLTSVSQDPPALAAAALKALAERLDPVGADGGDTDAGWPSPGDVVLPPRLVVRDTTGPAPLR